MNKTALIFTGILLFLSSGAIAQDIFLGFENLFTTPRNYVVYMADSQISVDGVDNETSWNKAKWTEGFMDIEGIGKPNPRYSTKVKMLWDNENLYVLAELEEPNIWAYYENHDQIVYHENDFEVFLDPDGDAQNYFEFEINARNTVFDLFMTKPYRDGGIPLITWDAPGLKTAVQVDGTINNPGDTDKKWTVEMAIPFETLRLGVVKHIPQNGEIWKIDFSRVEWQTEIKEGKYVRKGDADSQKLLPENNWVWSPIGIVNMHYPERWGMLQFSTDIIGSVNSSFQINKDEALKKYLWLVYYKQKKYFVEHKEYAKSLRQLSIPKTLKTDDNEVFKLKLFGTAFQFTVILNTPKGYQLTINNEGLIKKIAN